MRRVLVAGATGYLGKFVVQEFDRQGYWVRVLARNPEKLEKTGLYLEPAVRGQAEEIFTGQVTRPETLRGLCDNIDIVFSSVGITRQKDKLSYRDVDYQGNRNILDIAMSKSVRKFIYVSVFNAQKYQHLEIVKAHEDFVEDLKSCGLDYAVIRPTGYFSDMTEFLRMAKSGRIYLIGNGNNKLNPIHGADLAKICANTITSREHEISVGGPLTYSINEIAALAFLTLGKNAKVIRIPTWMAELSTRLIKPFNRHLSDLAAFYVAAAQDDNVAPATGDHTLIDYYQEMAFRMVKEMW